MVQAPRDCPDPKSPPMRSAAVYGTRPAPDLADEPGHHWLHSERSLSPGIAWWDREEWYVMNEGGHVTPEEMARRGWEYLGPVTGRPHSVYLDR